jgi:septal ring factor EnvC (AmiA/AmiB activator)
MADNTYFNDSEEKEEEVISRIDSVKSKSKSTLWLDSWAKIKDNWQVIIVSITFPLLIAFVIFLTWDYKYQLKSIDEELEQINTKSNEIKQQVIKIYDKENDIKDDVNNIENDLRRIEDDVDFIKDDISKIENNVDDIENDVDKLLNKSE